MADFAAHLLRPNQLHLESSDESCLAGQYKAVQDMRFAKNANLYCRQLDSGSLARIRGCSDSRGKTGERL